MGGVGAGCAGEQVASAPQQIVEVERPGVELGRGGGASEVGGHGQGETGDVGAVGFGGRAEAVAQGVASGQHELLAPRPVGRLAGVFRGEPPRPAGGDREGAPQFVEVARDRQGDRLGHQIEAAALQAIGVVAALQRGVGHTRRLDPDRRDRGSEVGRRRRLAGVDRKALGKPRVGELRDLLDRDAGAQDLGEKGGRPAAVPAVAARRPVGVEQPRQPVAPETLTKQLRRDLVELHEGGIDTRLDRPLAQQPGGEGVNGRDRGVVEARQGKREPLTQGRRLGVAGQYPFEAAADALAKFAGGLFGEGDGHHGGDRRCVGARQAGDVAIDEDARLAGAGARLDQEGRVELGRDAPAHVGVDGRTLVGEHEHVVDGLADVGHDEASGVAPAGSLKRISPRRRGSWRLAAKAMRSTPQLAAASQ